jgi:aryl-alcohol dehydrogenase-like predicted oxidoreductase
LAFYSLPVSGQVRFQKRHGTPPKPVEATAALGVSLLAFSPLGRSLLNDKPHSRATAAASGWLKSNPRFVEPNLTANIEASALFPAFASKMGMSGAALAIAWVLHEAPHILPIPETRSADHLR